MQIGVAGQRSRYQVQQPRTDHAAAPPDLGDLGEIQVVLVKLGTAQRRCFGIGFARVFAGVGMAQNVQAFGIRGHHAVFDTVVNHLHKVPRALRAAMQEALIRGAGAGCAARRGGRGARTRREGRENRLEPLHDFGLAADHQTVTALTSRDAAAGADVDVVKLTLRQLGAAANVVVVIGVAAVDHDVAGFEQGHELVERLVDHRGGHHQPHRARFLQLRDQIFKRRGTCHAFLLQLVHRGRLYVVSDALLTALRQAAHHVRAHASQSNHA